jgi:lantibiotic modifying enzyme
MDVYVPPAADGSIHGHCWARFIVAQPCSSVDEVEAYYRRCGVMLAVAEALGFSDGHEENVLASGEYPVLIDSETFFQPHSAQMSSRERVLQTMLLQERPKIFEPVNQSWLAAFQHPSEMPWASRHVGILNDKTSLMQTHYEDGRLETSRSLPRVDQKAFHIKLFKDQSCNGYNRAWAQIRDKGVELLQPHHDWYRRAMCSTVRVVPRPTSFYIMIMRLLQHVDAYRGRDAARSLLFRVFMDQNRPDLDALVPLEVEDLLRLDVPATYMHVSDGRITNGAGRSVESFFAEATLWTPNLAAAGETEAWQDLLDHDPEEDYDMDASTYMDFAFVAAKEV